MGTGNRVNPSKAPQGMTGDDWLLFVGQSQSRLEALQTPARYLDSCGNLKTATLRDIMHMKQRPDQIQLPIGFKYPDGTSPSSYDKDDKGVARFPTTFDDASDKPQRTADVLDTIQKDTPKADETSTDTPSAEQDKIEKKNACDNDVTKTAQNMANNRPAPNGTKTVEQMRTEAEQRTRASTPTTLRQAPSIDDVSRVPSSKDPKDDNHAGIYEGMQGPAVQEVKKTYNAAIERQRRDELTAQKKSEDEIKKTIQAERADKNSKFVEENDQWARGDGFTDKIKAFQKDNTYKGVKVGDPRHPENPDGVVGWRTMNALKDKAGEQTADNPPQIDYPAKQSTRRGRVVNGETQEVQSAKKEGDPSKKPEKCEEEKKVEGNDPTAASNAVGKDAWERMGDDTKKVYADMYKNSTEQQQQRLVELVKSKGFGQSGDAIRQKAIKAWSANKEDPTYVPFLDKLLSDETFQSRSDETKGHVLDELGSRADDKEWRTRIGRLATSPWNDETLEIDLNVRFIGDGDRAILGAYDSVKKTVRGWFSPSTFEDQQ
jgi:hypothetical protein